MKIQSQYKLGCYTITQYASIDNVDRLRLQSSKADYRIFIRRATDGTVRSVEVNRWYGLQVAQMTIRNQNGNIFVAVNSGSATMFEPLLSLLNTCLSTLQHRDATFDHYNLI